MNDNRSFKLTVIVVLPAFGVGRVNAGLATASIAEPDKEVGLRKYQMPPVELLKVASMEDRNRIE
jgi:hypothetical protein